MLSLIILLLTCFIYWKWYTRRLPGEPPFLPGCWPFIGHTLLIWGDTISLWRNLKEVALKCMNMGHALRIYTGPFKLYVLTDPDDISTVANTCFNKDQFSYEFTKDLLAEGLLFSPAPTWKIHRKLINPTFNQQIINGFIDIFNSQGKKLVKNLQDHSGKCHFDHSDHIRQNFMETICLTALDDSIEEDEVLKYVRAVDTYMNLTVIRFQRVWLYSDFIYQYSSLKKERDIIVKYLYDKTDALLQKKRALRDENNLNKDKGTNPKVKVFMDLLMELDNGVLTDREIRSELTTLMMSGQETTATVMEFTLILIGSHPEVQQRIYDELNEVLQDKDVEKNDLSKLVYLEAVLKESIRYFYIVPFVARYIDQEIKLKNCTLKPGYNCVLLLCGIHRNPEWGPDVDEFKPERWLDPARMPKNPNLLAGFSLGKRNCIGKSYAMTSTKVVLSHLLRRYKIHADHTKVVFRLDFVLKCESGHFISIEDRIKV